MTAILSLIWCWLQDFWHSVTDFHLYVFDGLLDIATGALQGIVPETWAVPEIADSYAWVLGALGLPQAFSIVASAWALRFILQTVPLVRWGS